MLTINIDLGSAQEVKALVIYDHNLSSAATITLKGVEPTIFSEAITWASGKIVHYLSAATTKRYWQLQITDAANADLYIEIGELFLGSYLELSRYYKEGYSEETVFLMESNRTPYGVGSDRFFNQQNIFNFNFGNLSEADVINMRTLITSIAERSSGTFKPFWFNKDSAATGNTWLVKIDSLPVKHGSWAYFDMHLVLMEVLTSA